jgi:putative metalloprotease
MSALLISAGTAIAFAVITYLLSASRTLTMLEAQSAPLADPGLRRLADRLAAALDLPALDIRVFEVEGVNGLAAPDGRIYLTRGFLNRYRAGAVTAEELAGVIAHELGHVAMGHTRRRMIDVTGQNAVFVLLSGFLSRFLPFVGIWLASLIAHALAAGLSRQAEHEADAYASALLVKAGIGTGPQKSLFAKLDRLTGAGGAAPDWLRSHPKTAERIARIEAREAAWGLD